KNVIKNCRLDHGFDRSSWTPCGDSQTSSGLWKDAVENRQSHRNPSRKLPIRMLKFTSFLRRSSTFRIEWITVEWCLPPKLRPISGRDACVSDLQRYIAIWRGIATDFELFRDFNSAIFRL